MPCLYILRFAFDLDTLDPCLLSPEGDLTTGREFSPGLDDHSAKLEKNTFLVG